MTDPVNSTRLFVLGILAKSGPMHGHQIRRAAHVDRTDLWSGVKPGALYGALHRMELEGVVSAVRTEQEGKRPARTVYEITPAGTAELDAHLTEALRTVHLPPDPIDLALQNVQDVPEDQVRAYIEDRGGELAVLLSAWHHLRDAALPHLNGFGRLSFRHTELRLLAEMEWHREVLDNMSKALAEEATMYPPAERRSSKRPTPPGRPLPAHPQHGVYPGPIALRRPGHEHVVLDLTEFGRGFHTELFLENAPDIPVCLQCFASPAGPFQGDDQPAVQPFVQRIQGHLVPQLGYQRTVPTKLKVRIDSQLFRVPVLLLEVHEVGLKQPADWHVRQGWTPPELECLADAVRCVFHRAGVEGSRRGLGQLTELQDVELLVTQGENVSCRTGFQDCRIP